MLGALLEKSRTLLEILIKGLLFLVCFFCPVKNAYVLQIIDGYNFEISAEKVALVVLRVLKD